MGRGSKSEEQGSLWSVECRVGEEIVSPTTTTSAYLSLSACVYLCALLFRRLGWESRVEVR